MNWKETIQYFAETSDISKPLSQKLISLTGLLESFLKQSGETSLQALSSELPEKSAEAFKDTGNKINRELCDRIHQLDLDEIQKLLRLTTMFFHLVNSLEQHEIISINRERAKKIDTENPRPKYVADA